MECPKGHTFVGGMHTGWHRDSHTAPRGLCWEIRELEGGAWEEAAVPAPKLRISGMLTWLWQRSRQEAHSPTLRE